VAEIHAAPPVLACSSTQDHDKQTVLLVFSNFRCSSSVMNQSNSYSGDVQPAENF